jgi:3-hydroxyacyl-CoA dehydrogenase
VIGTGAMGSGIAQVFAQAGYAMRLHARREATLAPGETGLRAGRGFNEYPPESADGAIAARDARLFEVLRLVTLPAFRDADAEPSGA